MEHGLLANDPDVDSDLLEQLTPEGLLGLLLALDVSTWKVPDAGIPLPSRRAVAKQDLVTSPEDGCHHPMLLHNSESPTPSPRTLTAGGSASQIACRQRAEPTTAGR